MLLVSTNGNRTPAGGVLSRVTTLLDLTFNELEKVGQGHGLSKAIYMLKTSRIRRDITIKDR